MTIQELKEKIEFILDTEPRVTMAESIRDFLRTIREEGNSIQPLKKPTPSKEIYLSEDEDFDEFDIV